MHQKNVMYVYIGIFLDKGFKYEPYLCNGSHDLMMLLLFLLKEMIIEFIFSI